MIVEHFYVMSSCYTSVGHHEEPGHICVNHSIHGFEHGVCSFNLSFYISRKVLPMIYLCIKLVYCNANRVVGHAGFLPCCGTCRFFTVLWDMQVFYRVVGHAGFLPCCGTCRFFYRVVGEMITNILFAFLSFPRIVRDVDMFYGVFFNCNKHVILHRRRSRPHKRKT